MRYYDQAGVGRVAALERSILRLHNPNQGEFIAILNAIEAHVEEADGSPEVVRHLGQALLELGRYRGLHPDHLQQLQRKLKLVEAHVRDQRCSSTDSPR